LFEFVEHAGTNMFSWPVPLGDINGDGAPDFAMGAHSSVSVYLSDLCALQGIHRISDRTKTTQ